MYHIYMYSLPPSLPPYTHLPLLQPTTGFTHSLPVHIPYTVYTPTHSYLYTHPDTPTIIEYILL